MITSPSNPRIVAAAKLHRSRARAAAGATLLEGPHLVAEAFDAGFSIETVFTVDRDLTQPWLQAAGDTPIEEVSPRVLSRLAGTDHPRGPIAVMRIPAPQQPQRADTVVLVGLADPGNAGTIIRSAGAFDFQVAFSPGTVDAWSPKVLRAGSGGHFRVPITTVSDDAVADLQKVGMVAAALTVVGGEAIEALPADRPVAFLVGNEPRGLGTAIVAAADVAVTLPMPGTAESLNAAVAASIAMYERRSLVPKRRVR